jgi:hypothetical protein
VGDKRATGEAVGRDSRFSYSDKVKEMSKEEIENLEKFDHGR